MGHARCYVTFDIIRRILTDYFGFNVQYVMNITDIDDKIIMRARSIHLSTLPKSLIFAGFFNCSRNHLMSEYESKAPSTQQLESDAISAFDFAKEKSLSKIADIQKRQASAKKRIVEELAADIQQEQLKLQNLENERIAFLEALAEEKKSSTAAAASKNLISAAKSALSDWLDSKFGGEAVDQKIFQLHSQRYEREFFADMHALNVRDPDSLTRVSEYVDEIIKLVQRIIDRGYGYESKGSVYFDVAAYAKHSGQPYGKLAPWSVGNALAQQDADGALSTGEQSEKRSDLDFALWKASKRGEPAWSSPWGMGRPGWHIECSAMASDILGTKIDVHSGGSDLKFPHR